MYTSLMKIFYISEKVRKCIRALEAAETDTQKFAALFLVPKLVRGTECDKNARMCIMKVCKVQFSKTCTDILFIRYIFRFLINCDFIMIHETSSCICSNIFYYKIIMIIFFIKMIKISKFALSRWFGLCFYYKSA